MIRINEELCNNCGICVDICPNIVLSNNNGDTIADNQDLCCNCGHCVLYCPPKALTHEEISEKQIVKADASKISTNDLEQLMMMRRSTRYYKDDPVPKDKIESLLNTAINAGTGSNLQSEHFIVIQNRDFLKQLELMSIEILWDKGLKFATNKSMIGRFIKRKIPDEVFFNFNRYHKIIDRRRNTGRLAGMVFRNAPCVILMHGYKKEALSSINSAIAVRNMELSALTMDLGTCWIGLLVSAARMDRKKINSVLQIDKNRQISGALMVGYPKYSTSNIIRRHERMIHWM